MINSRLFDVIIQSGLRKRGIRTVSEGVRQFQRRIHITGFRAGDKTLIVCNHVVEPGIQ